MIAKEQKTKEVLESIIMDQLQRNADWRRIKRVVVTPLQRIAPHHPNWDAAFVVDGADLRPADVQHLIAALQNEYDLIDA